MSLPNAVLGLPDATILERRPESLLYLGKTWKDREIWLTREEMTRHLLVIGSTGSGKSELLLGMSANAIASGNGVLFVDGKGDVATFARLYAIAEQFGRRDDMLLLNFSQGVPVGDKPNRFLSNTLNPFLDLTADAIVQILVSLMEDAGGDSAMWKGRAIAMVTGVVRAAAWRRDHAGVEINVGDMRDLCSLASIINLADPMQHPEMPKSIRKVLLAYLSSLPGFDPTKGSKQAQTTLDQHGYLEMQTTRLFSTLADVYQHIFDAASSHIDMKDVVLNRRIVMVMLPVLEKSSDEVANLGRIVVALLKNMMSSAMHAPIEGSWADVVEKRPTNADYPFLVILDEVSHYMTDGMAAMAGQARSLGFCLVFATQDLGQMEAASRRETSAIVANANVQIIMRQTNPTELDRREMLPRQQRFNSPRADADDLLRDRISWLSEQLRWGEHRLSTTAQDELWSQLNDAYTQKIGLAEEQPNWSLTATVKALRPGEYVVLQGDSFLLGRAPRVDALIRSPGIALNHFVSWRPNLDRIREQHEQTSRLAARRIAFADNPMSVLTVEPLPFAEIWQQHRTKGAKGAIRKSFALAQHLHIIPKPGAAAAPPRRNLVVLGDMSCR